MAAGCVVIGGMQYDVESFDMTVNGMSPIEWETCLSIIGAPPLPERMVYTGTITMNPGNQAQMIAWMTEIWERRNAAYADICERFKHVIGMPVEVNDPREWTGREALWEVDVWA